MKANEIASENVQVMTDRDEFFKKYDILSKVFLGARTNLLIRSQRNKPYLTCKK